MIIHKEKENKLFLSSQTNLQRTYWSRQNRDTPSQHEMSDFRRRSILDQTIVCVFLSRLDRTRQGPFFNGSGTLTKLTGKVLFLISSVMFLIRLSSYFPTLSRPSDIWRPPFLTPSLSWVLMLKPLAPRVRTVNIKIIHDCIIFFQFYLKIIIMILNI